MGSPAPAAPVRLASLDAYRGLMLALMTGEALRFCSVSAAIPASAVLAFLCHHQDHVPWVGGSLHDQIQPGFSFLVGAALRSRSRRARGAARAARGWWHTPSGAR
jgi:predicted acyltransferase